MKLVSPPVLWLIWQLVCNVEISLFFSPRYRRCIWEVRRWRWTGMVQRQEGWMCWPVPSKLCWSGITITWLLLNIYTKCFLPKWNAGHCIPYLFVHYEIYGNVFSWNLEEWEIALCSLVPIVFHRLLFKGYVGHITLDWMHSYFIHDGEKYVEYCINSD
jgi:hypothetical protein